MPTVNFAAGDVQYGNNLNPLAGRYQSIFFAGYSAATNATIGTVGTTQVLFPNLAPLDLLQLLNVCILYPAASGAITTPGTWTLNKLAAGTATPVVLLSSQSIFTEANIPINTIRKFSVATQTGATYQTNQVGLDMFTFPLINAGDLVYLLLGQVGIGGVQAALQFNLEFRERPLYPVGPTLASAGTSTVFT